MEKVLEVNAISRVGVVSENAVEAAHVSKMDNVHDKAYGKSLPIIGHGDKGKQIHQAFVYSRGMSMVEGIHSICIAQCITQSWGGPKFGNSKTGNILTGFQQSSKSFDTNENVKYRYAFVKVGDMALTSDIEAELAKKAVYIKNYYSNSVMNVLTDEQIQMIANDKLDIVKVADKLLLRDKDGNAILDINGNIVFRQSFAEGEYQGDYVDVTWKKGGKGLSIDKALEIVAEKAKALVV